MDTSSISQYNSTEMSDFPRRRRRPPLSCITCRRRKLKCDRSLPCAQCIRSKTVETCSYVDATSGPISNPRRSGTPPRSRAEPTSLRRNVTPTGRGVHVFDSKHKSSDQRGTSTQLNEIHELRSRVQTLENALSLPGAIPTPETWNGGEACHSGVGAVSRLAPEDEMIREQVDAVPEKYFRGRNSRTRVVGRCHWTLSISFFRDIGATLKHHHRAGREPKSPNAKAINQFRSDLWSQQRRNHERAYQEHAFRIEEMLPPREVADDLLRLYLSTFETTYRILHVPSFLEEYNACWSGAQKMDAVFIAKLLALMAAGSCFYDQRVMINGKDSIQDVAGMWIMAVQSWVASVFVSPSVDFNMLQIQCLLMIACQANGAEGDVVWISTGSLVRSAVVMGLHRDTTCIPNVSKFWAEMRRRLWTTICELELQSSLDGGMLPTIDLDECDCGQPSDCDDEDLSEDMMTDPAPKPVGKLTRSSFQVLLSQSLPVRFRIVKLICSLKFSLTYDEALRLSEELVQSMNEVLSMFRSGPGTGTETFTQSYLIFLLRKYLLILHQPFFVNVQSSPKFSFSRKVCVESSIEMLSQLESPIPDKPNTPHLGGLGGMLRNEFFRAATTLCVEMSLQAEEFQRSTLSPAGTSFTEMIRTQQSGMLHAVEGTIEVFRSMIGPEGKGTRAFIFLSMALASVKARLVGDDPPKRVEEASLGAVRECKELMGMSRAEARREPAETVPPGIDPSGAGITPTWSTNLPGFTPLDFGNLVDIYDYGVPELWDNGFFSGF